MSHHRHRDAADRTRSRGSTGSCGSSCFIGGTLQGVADRLGIAKLWVALGLILVCIISLPLGIIAFFLARYWVRHPGRLEHHLERLAASLGRFFSAEPAPATETGSGNTTADVSAEFADLRRRFEDLERRAGRMESQVTSEEYELNRAFARMKGRDS